MVVLGEIKIQESNNTMLDMLYTRASFVKKSSCLVAGIVSLDTAGLHLLLFRILEPFPSTDSELDLGRVISN